MGYLFCYCVHKMKILLMRFLANANFSRSQKQHKARTPCRYSFSNKFKFCINSHYELYFLFNFSPCPDFYHHSIVKPQALKHYRLIKATLGKKWVEVQSRDLVTPPTVFKFYKNMINGLFFKGHFISKGHFGVFKSTKKTNEIK